jgi:SMP-30/Gluconolactonase/LRE-like region
MTETVYSFLPGTSEDQVTILERQPAEAREGMTSAIPVDYWVNGDFSNTLNTATYEYVTLDQMFRSKISTRKPYQYVSADHSVYIPANEVFVQGEPYFGSKWSDILMATGLVKATPGKTFYLTGEAEEKTYRGKMNDDGTVSDPKVFAYQGGESLAEDKAGNVYLAAGQIYVRDGAGKLIDVVEVPERPTHLVFGGTDHRTLFILCNSSIYSVRTRAEGL